MSKATLREVLESIKPSDGEIKKEQEFARKIIKKLRVEGGKTVLTGSVAKKTFLKKGRDLDVFVLFQKNVKKSSFEKIIKNAVEKSFPKEKYEIRYAEHPYVRLYIEGRKIDVVPAYQIKKAEERLSAVDRSVLHTKYILRNLEKVDDVLLLKQFLKSNGMYGAEIKVEGFSGYLCELLIIKYGSFVKLLKNAVRWKSPVIIDIEKYWKRKDELEKRFDCPLIVIDPTDKNRNVAAALSEKNFKKFISKARLFLKNPKKEMFFKEENIKKKIERMKKKGNAYFVKFKTPEIVDDVLWGQLKKLSKNIETFLKEFEVLEMLLYSDSEKTLVVFRVRNEKLPEKKKVRGPFKHLEKNVKEFRKVHKKIFFREGRAYAVEKRRLRDVEKALKEFFKNGKSVPSRFKKLKVQAGKVNK